MAHITPRDSIRNLLAIWSLLILPLCSQALAQSVPFEALSDSEIAALERSAGLQYDIDFLVNHAQTHHAGPSRPAYSAAFLDQAAALRERVAQLSDLEVLTGLMRLVAILNDGHSTIYGPGPDTRLNIDGGSLPLRFYWFEEGLYIIDGQGESAELAGSRVVRLGDLTPDEVMQRLAALRGTDNDMTLVWMGPQFLMPQLPLLRAIGATTSTTAIELTLEDSAGNVRQISVAAGDFPLIRKLRPSPAASNPVPMYLQQVDSNFWLAPLPTHQALYLQFNQVRDNEDQSLAEFAEYLAQQLANHDSHYLIIDVRHNNGGNNRLLRPMIQQLIAFEQADHEHRLFVITGRNTFSAAQNFINRVERWTDAIFVGEPSASSPNFVGEETQFMLPYSRVMGSLSDLYWQDSDPGDARPWITPEISVPVTAADYFRNRDAAMAAVLAYIESQ